MYRLLSRLAAPAMAVVACAFVSLNPAVAADPASGTISTASPQLSFTSGPHAVSNPSAQVTGEPDCETAPCDHFDLTLEVPGDYDVSHPYDVLHIEASWPDASEDFDFYLFDEDGNEVQSAATGEDPEIMEVPAGAGTQRFRIRIVPFAVTGGTATVSVQLKAGTDPCVPSGEPASGTSRMSVGLARDLRRLAPADPYGAFVHFSMGTPAEHGALLQRLGLVKVADFERYASAVFATGPVSAFRALSKEPSVSYLEQNRQVRFLGETQSWATRARVAQEPVAGGPYYDAEGRVLRGEGVTVVVVDSGLNAAHPDFAGRVLHNWKITGDPIASGQVEFVDAGYSDTDTTSGHGTHVNGIAVGSGAASTGDYPVEGAAPNVRGTFTGAAPAANLIAYSVGEAPDPGVGAPALLIYIDSALNHLLENFDAVTPKVRVVSLSLGDGGGSNYNPGDVTSCLVKGLIAKGTNVVWAAGNDGGTGSTDQTSSFCKDPTPGVLCVASYDDGTSGKLDGYLSSFSSRGKNNKFRTYPDITAPGSSITAACVQGTPGQTTCSTGAETRWQPYYGRISGTSMATPHVSGTIALLAQARPDLTPQQIETLLQNTARKLLTNGPYAADPQNAGGTTNVGFGAGLLDIPAALDALGVSHAGLPAAGGESILIDGDADESIAGAADVVRVTAEESAPPLLAGLVYRLSVRDGADFGSASGVTYRLEQNVNGVHFETDVAATADGVSPVEENLAPASGPVREGNVITFLLPYEKLGYPPTGSPVHNIRVTALDLDSGEALDGAPSPANSTGADAALRPMFGKSFTVLSPETNLPPVEPPGDLCVLPGFKLFSDGQQDDTPPSPTADNGSADVLWLRVAEPADQPAKLVFTMQVRSLETLPPNVSWYVIFYGPKKGLNETGKWHVEMQTNEASAVTFEYGRYDPANQNFARGPNTDDGDEPVATAMEGSSYDAATGTITLVVNKSNFGVAGDALANIGVETYQLVGASAAGGVLEPIDSAGGSLVHTLRAADGCGAVSQTGELASGSGVFVGGGFGLPALVVLGGLAGLGWRRRRA